MKRFKFTFTTEWSANGKSVDNEFIFQGEDLLDAIVREDSSLIIPEFLHVTFPAINTIYKKQGTYAQRCFQNDLLNGWVDISNPENLHTTLNSSQFYSTPACKLRIQLTEI